ncbi:MAG: aldehyde reductase [Bacteroidales bacterium]|nr:aldehyde reductase [Bacteroidales bacterium]MCF8328308.1 aldehyde reductase [Bacteroidales bacterium]
MKILVTGGSGFIASHIISLLLKDGHHVVTTVRNLNDKEKISHLEELAKEDKYTLDLAEADLLQEGSFKAPMQECDVVIHTASPFKISGIKNAKEQLINPAVKGTENVLKAVNQTPSVKKVVLTSSVASIHGDNADIQDIKEDKFNEDHWNTSSSENHQAYSYSKTAAEKTAWQLANEQLRWKLAVINPGFVIGPSLTKRKDSTSINFMISFLNGEFKMGVPELYFGVVDVRDVAQAHVKAALNENAEGRYIMVSETKSTLDMAKILQSHLGASYPIPKKKLPKAMLYLAGPFAGFSRKFIKRNIGIPVYFDNSRAKRQLDISYRPVEESLKEQADQVIRDGLLKKK